MFVGSQWFQLGLGAGQVPGLLWLVPKFWAQNPKDPHRKGGEDATCANLCDHNDWGMLWESGLGCKTILLCVFPSCDHTFSKITLEHKGNPSGEFSVLLDKTVLSTRVGICLRPSELAWSPHSDSRPRIRKHNEHKVDPKVVYLSGALHLEFFAAVRHWYLNPKAEQTRAFISTGSPYFSPWPWFLFLTH